MKPGQQCLHPLGLSLLFAIVSMAAAAGCESSGTMARVGTSMKQTVNFSGVPPQSEPKVDDDPPTRTR
ncbi:MAG: hypothetical protein IT428_12525 [Planctomycetaceae bacterium]|nr:hypothetical protein [Planctomycetaceae bacterium]